MTAYWVGSTDLEVEFSIADGADVPVPGARVEIHQHGESALAARATKRVFVQPNFRYNRQSRLPILPNMPILASVRHRTSLPLAETIP
jgi:hypothetical protein